MAPSALPTAAIHQMASKDMNFALQSKARVEQTMDNVQNMNRQVNTAVSDMAAISARVEQDVGVAVTSLQFQDMVTQLVGHTRRRIDLLDQALGRISQQIQAGTTPSGSDLAAWRRCLAEIRSLAKESEQKHSPVRQDSITAGDIELF